MTYIDFYVQVILPISKGTKRNYSNNKELIMINRTFRTKRYTEELTL